MIGYCRAVAREKGDLLQVLPEISPADRYAQLDKQWLFVLFFQSYSHSA